MAQQQKFETVSGAHFLAAIVREDKYYDLQGVGLVKIRGLSTKEAQDISQKYEDNRAALVVNVVAVGLTEPALTEEQVAALYDAKSGPISRLFEEISSMSAIAQTEKLQGEVGTGS